ncbi:Phytoene/squalene synthetase [Paramicrosporidium saccamoebae]|uniref:Phytoene/squalene synthetase n=1 Tax=Paramicrosporidium saccamoebae TaxID=1246581 RepID=A0A2H9THU2_9FUNG|nr:Phytoene/squalene synthetase [Paramicrosporidium saccamoebae]
MDNPILSILNMYSSGHGTIQFRLRQFLDAKPVYFDMSEIENYSEKTFSNLLCILLEYCGIKDLDADHVASHVGKALGIVAFIKSAVSLSRKGLDSGIPMSLLSKAGISQESLKQDAIWSEEGPRNCIHNMADTAYIHLSHAEKYMEKASPKHPLLRRIFLPAKLSAQYLDALQMQDFDLSSASLYKLDKWLPVTLTWQLYKHPHSFRGLSKTSKRNSVKLGRPVKKRDHIPSTYTSDATRSAAVKCKPPCSKRDWRRACTLVAIVILSLPQGKRWFLLTTSALMVVSALEFFIGKLFLLSRAAEIPDRLRRIHDEFVQRGMEYGEVQEPPSRAINLVRVLRDGNWRLLPVNLLVEGDTFQLSPGDDLGISCRKRDIAGMTTDLFEVMETPLQRQLEVSSFLCSIDNPWKNSLQPVTGWLYMCQIFIAALTLFLCCIGVQDNAFCQSMLVGLFISFVLVSPIWTMLFFCFGNARLIALTEVLQKSKTPYLEAEDVDEFDEEAPPPTKDIYLNPLDILRTIKSAFQQNLSHFLFWQYDLTESFSSVSVLSFLDREGPIANV